MAEVFNFERQERVEVAEMPLRFRCGTEVTKGGERRYLNLEITDDYSIWGTLSDDQTEAWIEQVNLREGEYTPQIAERLLKGFAVAASNVGVHELWMASASPQDLELLARAYGGHGLTFCDTVEGVNVALPMALDQALDSIGRIQAKEDVEPYPLIGYFDVRIRVEALDTETWEQPLFSE